MNEVTGSSLVSQDKMEASVHETSQTVTKNYLDMLETLGLSYPKLLQKLDISLTEMLYRSGLEKEYWTTVLKEKLGISTTSHLQALCPQDPNQECSVEGVIQAARSSKPHS